LVNALTEYGTETGSAAQILVSSLVKELTDSSGAFQFGEPFDLELKGLPGQQRAYDVSWNGETPAG
jgi:hypothetical protein